MLKLFSLDIKDSAHPTPTLFHYVCAKLITRDPAESQTPAK